MRPASEIADQICGCATREQHQRDIALIEADRQALVTEICEWLDMKSQPHFSHIISAAIQAKWGSPE